MAPSTPSGDEFVNIWMSDTPNSTSAHKESTDFYSQWVDKSSAKLAIPPITGTHALRRLYPKHSIVLTQGYGMNIFGFPAASFTPLKDDPLVTNLFFVPLSRASGLPGVLTDQVQYGGFKVTWRQFDFIVYILTYPFGFGSTTQYFVLHEGPEDASRLFLLSAGAWANGLHDEIWVFNQGFWAKDHGLWLEVQKADWKDVILKDEFKKALQKDIYGFFSSEKIYKELGIPWKRGLIMYGPPGNGKTISLKTIMKTCGEKGFAPLYVKSFQSWKGEEGAMADVFDKARQYAPCVVILEDLDSLINDRNRSFFLNQLDGLEGNDGLLIIGTTNHFDRLDPGLSSRPSRFDRKYLFNDPDEAERILYAQYWQRKLENNPDVEFPDKLVVKVARLTDRFSFAYLKEAFVSALVTFVGVEGEKPTFESVLIDQINILRKQLDKPSTDDRSISSRTPSNSTEDPYHSDRATPPRPPRPNSTAERDVRALLDALSDGTPSGDAHFRELYRNYIGQTSENGMGNDRSIRTLLDSLSASLTSADVSSARTYTSASSHRYTGVMSGNVDEEGRGIRPLLERMSTGQTDSSQHNSDRHYYTSNPLEPRGNGVWSMDALPSWSRGSASGVSSQPFGSYLG